mmetsp:Transcript_172600/g.548039  ORF Transcript_172600/g.548039 Transcript_172600/m.548039 type:complete len:265 (+) Transcript_172600:567-1361(+)
MFNRPQEAVNQSMAVEGLRLKFRVFNICCSVTLCTSWGRSMIKPCCKKRSTSQASAFCRYTMLMGFLAESILHKRQHKVLKADGMARGVRNWGGASSTKLSSNAMAFAKLSNNMPMRGSTWPNRYSISALAKKSGPASGVAAAAWRMRRTSSCSFIKPIRSVENSQSSSASLISIVEAGSTALPFCCSSAGALDAVAEDDASTARLDAGDSWGEGLVAASACICSAGIEQSGWDPATLGGMGCRAQRIHPQVEQPSCWEMPMRG